MFFVSLGRFDLYKYKVLCQDCNSVNDPFNVETIIKSGFWPGSLTHINYIIKEDVFSIWDSFRKRMPGSSERSFLMSLNDMAAENGRVSKDKSFVIVYLSLFIDRLVVIV